MHKYLVVADLATGSNQLQHFIRERSGERGSTFHLVVPALPDRRRLTWDESEAHFFACRRLAQGLAWLREVDPGADGEVGDADPILAIGDAVRARSYDTIVLAIGEWPHRHRMHVAARARRAFGFPVVDALEAPRVAEFHPTVSLSIPRRSA